MISTAIAIQIRNHFIILFCFYKQVKLSKNYDNLFLQSMSSELNMYESQVNEYKYEIERIARELVEVKKKYFMQKKKEQQTK